ncbi:MAG: FadR/GntR family transcriptional regulator [Phenylobacterium sp.]|uniref:FadR/GntR family transcriptional regulator n=1 Tax=Phenylobacterium sp. TaxID=1871053 RepID=UPI0027250021|nr:FadR/GntR family transcriptional regulator [Phenylobacterium sp.]MDO8322774.1 FadR/GntR family transcriptional regulator [Phenylobacterium sp.]MDO8911448.1 FadR/GntR family transcriptional regulator [Phenylobacterium sp.]MDO9246515.1 FadR/GntR family transcriptional regulator [Phenylobacterium sp.]MDP2011512.1 FadR/GntR family transcriptional regulator [Phenylobacterium sp.]MDP3098908.1 FadR/GntR family transcriptional regulator [Phenylobacterium sp.]
MRTTHGRSFTHDIVQRLGQEIVCGVYGAQNPFPIEAELCKRLGVSRSVLREAVKMLTTKGLLNARPRQGTWVEPETNWNLLDPDVLRWFLQRKFSPTLLLEFTQVRLAIEPMAASMAARLASDEAKAAIIAGLDRMKAAERGEDDPLESDIAFHVAILRASGNRFLAQMRDLIDVALRTSIRLTNRRKGVRLASIADHQKVSDAILAGDAEGASRAMRELMLEALVLIEQDAAAGVAAGA